MTLTTFETLLQPLAHWAQQRPHDLALADEQRQWSYAQLQQLVAQRALALQQARAPRECWVGSSPAGWHSADALIDFLAIIASGRCAAVADPDWPPALRAALQPSLSQAPADLPPPGPLTPFYIGFTSGSSGRPKGFRRHHRSWTASLHAAFQTFGPAAASRVLAPGRLSHSLFLFGMLQGLCSGAGVHVQQQFSAPRALDTLARDQARCLVAVPSQLQLMLTLAERRKLAPIAHTELILISGARWLRARTPALQQLFPQARIIEFYGASETSFVAWTEADAQLPPEVVGHPFDQVEIAIHDAPAPGQDGLLFVHSPMLFMDYAGPAPEGDDASAALRHTDAQGRTWLSVRDMGHLDAQGRLCLAGRQQRMIVTQGKNLFPEEVEAVLMSHPAVAAASLQALPDDLRGQRLLACVQLTPDTHPPLRPASFDPAPLVEWCRQRLEPYKVPRQFQLCKDWPLTASGKTDHRQLASWLRTQPIAP
jgi:long-chain acyl-CoA synthetase